MELDRSLVELVADHWTADRDLCSRVVDQVARKVLGSRIVAHPVVAGDVAGFEQMTVEAGSRRPMVDLEEGRRQVGFAEDQRKEVAAAAVAEAARTSVAKAVAAG